MKPLAPKTAILRRLLAEQGVTPSGAETAPLAEKIAAIVAWDLSGEACALRQAAERELIDLLGEGRVDGDPEALLAREIRAGRRDASAAVHRVLCALAAAALPAHLR